MRRRAFLLSLFAASGLALVPLSSAATSAAATWSDTTARALAPAALVDLRATLQRASEILPLLAAAVHPGVGAPDPAAWAAQPLLGASLSTYAKNTGADPRRFESFEEASRRILAGTTPLRRAPEATSRWLDESATLLLATVRSAEAVPSAQRPPAFDAAVADVKVLALYARFHARRVLAAVHYNLFLRSQRLAELYAATLDARACLVIWRELVAAVGDRAGLTFPVGPQTVTVRAAWREELIRLGYDVTDLEAQCCPPDEAMLTEKVWTPAPAP